jgi:hypothetical protein
MDLLPRLREDVLMTADRKKIRALKAAYEKRYYNEEIRHRKELRDIETMRVSMVAKCKHPKMTSPVDSCWYCPDCGDSW